MFHMLTTAGVFQKTFLMVFRLLEDNEECLIRQLIVSVRKNTLRVVVKRLVEVGALETIFWLSGIFCLPSKYPTTKNDEAIKAYTCWSWKFICKSFIQVFGNYIQPLFFFFFLYEQLQAIINIEFILHNMEPNQKRM